MFPTRRITTSGGDKFRDEHSLAFDGSNEYVDLGNQANSGDVISVSAWIKLLDSNINTVLQWGDMLIRMNDDTSLMVWADVAGSGSDATVPSGLNNWFHICAVIDGNSVHHYHNGIFIETDTGLSTLSTDSGGSYIGKFSSHYFNGNISEVAIYNSALTANQVKTIYNGREPYNHKEGVASGNLQAWYRMGDGVNDVANADSEGGIIGDEVTPTLGSNLWDSPASVFTSGTYNWTAYSGTTLSNDSNTLKIVKDDDSLSDGAQGAYIYLRNATDLSSDLTAGKVYKLTFDAKVDTGDSVTAMVNEAGNTDNIDVIITNTSFQTFNLYFLAGHASNAYFGFYSMATGEIAWVDNLSLQEVGGNAGAMQNMEIVDFQGDTP